MAKYKLQLSGVLDTETGKHIPSDAGNTDWIEYQEWLAEGNTPDPEFTQEEIDLNNQRDQQWTRLNALKQATVDQFDMIMALFQAGRDKGLWTPQDFPADLRQKLLEWRQLVDDIRANAGETGITMAITGQQEFIK